MAKKAMTKEEREYVNRVIELGCVICGMPAEYHHKTTGIGMGQRASHFDGFGLCPLHHRTGGHGFAIHAGKKTWEAKYGYETEHLAAIKERLLDE